MRSALAAVAALMALAGCDDTETHIKTTNQPPTAPIIAASKVREVSEQPFDFYVLALSWSPSYCAAAGSNANQQQCGARRSYSFVVHGLWPQFEKGFPADCKTDMPRVPDDLVRSLYDIMPSAGLIGHQWRRHGSCSGLAMEDYFAKVRAAREKIAIPADYRRPETARKVDPKAVEAGFIDVNRGLVPEAISVSCDDGYLSEIRLCMTKDLAFRPCPALERRSCKATTVTMPPVGG
ncbi:MAG: ribonuclease [Rhizobiaceae bacterium]